MKIIISFVMAILCILGVLYFQEKSAPLTWLCIIGAGIFLYYLYENRPRPASQEQREEIVKKILEGQPK